MDAVLQDLLPGSDLTAKEDREYCLKSLAEVLESENKNYESYFTSSATSGSIVEDIAELDAQISSLERKLRHILVANQTSLLNDVIDEKNENDDTLLSRINEQLEQLWELDTSSKKNNENNKNNATLTKREEEEDISIEDFLKDDSSKKQTTMDDEFHKALKSLRKKIFKEETQSGDGQIGLAFVLENLTSIIDLMELPFLTRTCIKTGHYQEAIMLYQHTSSLKSKFPDSVTISNICKQVSTEIIDTMSVGLIKLLSSNLTLNSIKKILNYLICIPPFSENSSSNSALLNVYLKMRLKFIQNEISSYSTDIDDSNTSLYEMMIKRKIEVIREHIFMSLNVYEKSFTIETQPLLIPLQLERVQRKDKPRETNPLMLKFVNDSITYLLNELKIEKEEKMKEQSNSVCLQLIYCSFRLSDLNTNYHNLFINQIIEFKIFTVEQVVNAIQKRSELATTYL
ncbi:hypothetical protein KAFR_0I00320 [Kazachstania africana CBS 2517]|uniref:Conserved oligomeric Golgi complex subunit 8 n=1 Tax=Kazachstania africana (strain ATCC 22294 / BCRC 22015 / CBS 2517 / CECT 1963 / NBRC 1671 / NRRL Y-8276) TaxID=1071382 RepID=H2AZL3_KAZAF|nr:hypothetical protein KAFR_0I00320 [Kazachstania africana CBS 2517]CCF59813.1 hypothetical protein KAFR_0I00320 [Kazachstania africana CBS 2517]